MSIIYAFLVTIMLVINMKRKKSIIVISVILAVLIGVGVYIYYNNSKINNQNEYEAEKTSSEKNGNNSENTQSQDSNNTSQDNQTANPDGSTQNTQSENPHVEINPQVVEQPPQPVEEQIAIFSTKIYSTDSARQNNINITCNTLNGTVVKNGTSFSFCNTVGQATTSKGYQKADIFDKNGNKKKGLGGGNCQISTTLYNAVLAVPSLVVTERHQHSNYVPYIQKGKDAAVAYGSYDFKFTNSSGNDIKIMASSDGKNVTVSLIALK